MDTASNLFSRKEFFPDAAEIPGHRDLIRGPVDAVQRPTACARRVPGCRGVWSRVKCDNQVRDLAKIGLAFSVARWPSSRRRARKRSKAFQLRCREVRAGVPVSVPTGRQLEGVWRRGQSGPEADRKKFVPKAGCSRWVAPRRAGVSPTGHVPPDRESGGRNRFSRNWFMAPRL